MEPRALLPLLLAGSALGDRRYDGGYPDGRSGSPYGKATPSNFAELLPPTVGNPGVPMMLLLSQDGCAACAELSERMDRISDLAGHNVRFCHPLSTFCLSQAALLLLCGCEQAYIGKFVCDEDLSDDNGILHRKYTRSLHHNFFRGRAFLADCAACDYRSLLY